MTGDESLEAEVDEGLAGSPSLPPPLSPAIIPELNNAGSLPSCSSLANFNAAKEVKLDFLLAVNGVLLKIGSPKGLTSSGSAWLILILGVVDLVLEVEGVLATDAEVLF